jgi:serine/threonine protein kinase
VAASAANAALRRQFLEEARALAAVQHENVVAIHAVHDEPVPYFVMEYVAGPSLQQKLAETGPLELKQILRIGHQIAAGLAAIHRHGLLHRAIRPNNILLGEGVDRVKITDFGLASITLGTPTYMAPEQAMSDEVDQRADLFSLGTVLYLMCTGRAPFGETSSLAILKHVVEDQPRDIRELNRDIPPWLCEIIGKLHAKLPADRYQSADEVAELLLDRLAELQLHGEVAASPREEAAKPQPPRRRAWRTAVALLSFLIVFGDLLVAYYYDWPPFQPPAAAPSDESSPAAADEGTLDVQVNDDALRITVRRVGPEPTVRPGKIWVQATRDGAPVFEQFVEVGRGERKSLSIDARASEVPPRREPLR